MRLIKTIFAVSAAVAVSCYAVFFWNSPGAVTDGNVRVIALDVGQGDAMLVRTPHGSDILFDGGPPGAGIANKLARHLPPSDRDIELVVVSHADSDHVGGLPEVAAHYRIDRVLDSGAAATSVVYRQWAEAIDDQNTEKLFATAGVSVAVDGVFFDVLWPERGMDAATADRNDASVVVRMRYGATSFLFTGDITATVEARLLATHIAVDADVLKVAHHGSAYSTSTAFLDAVRPSIAFISVGSGNRYGHPHDVVLKRLSVRGIATYRTDATGDIVLETNGTDVHNIP